MLRKVDGIATSLFTHKTTFAMAKSLRASSKVKHRNARRYTPGNDYTVTHAARLEAVSKRLASRMKAQESSASDEDKSASHESDKGWYLCFERNDKGKVWADLELLGLIDPQSIGLEECCETKQHDEASIFSWMFESEKE